MVRFFERVSAGSQPIQQPGRCAPKSPSAATPEASIVRRVFGESLPSLYGDLIATGVTHACLRGSSRFWSRLCSSPASRIGYHPRSAGKVGAPGGPSGGSAISAVSPARGVQNAQIWMAGVVIGIEPTSAPNGGYVSGE
jgi:hypothetical protein